MDCIVCKKKFDVIKKYIMHLEYSHKATKFICPIVHCNRVFQRKDSFKQHLGNKHNIKNELKELARPQDFTINELEKSTNMAYDKATESTGDSKPGSNVPIDKGIKNHIEEQFLHVQNYLIESAQIFVTKLYGNSLLNRVCIQKIINDVQDLLSSHIFCVINSIIEEYFSKYEDLTVVITYVKLMLDTFTHIFKLSGMHTEYKRNTWFNESGTFVKPTKHTLGIRQDSIRDSNQVSLALKNATSTFISMRSTLKIFLELPNVFWKINDYLKTMECASDNVLVSLVQCKLWNSGFPLIMYFNDFECGNPLGSHAGIYKIGAVYYTLGAMPLQYSTRLENIFVALLFHSDDRKFYGNKSVFAPLLYELLHLAKEGISITIDNQCIQVYFELTIINGDNLGVHSILGLTESFSSNYFCRFCTSSKLDTQKQLSESLETIRQPGNYQEHLENSAFGVKTECIWNELPNFHIYENICCDIMHDLFEGVFRYDMALIIRHLVESNYCSLDILNSRILYFTFHKSENKPPQIKSEQINKAFIIMSAAEMLCLVRNFKFIVGDLVPEANLVWTFYLKLLDITNIVCSKSIARPAIDMLDVLITEHHQLYISAFQQNLKPKHHFMVHYKRVLLATGPLSLLSCMRFEAKHRDFKNIAKNITSRVNLPHSLAIRIQENATFRFISKRGLQDDIQCGKIETILQDLNLSELLKEHAEDNLLSTNRYDINNQSFNVSDVISVDGKDQPELGIIIYIFVNKNDINKCLIVYNILEIINFSSHYRAYKVQQTSKKKTVFAKNILNNITVLHKIKNENFVSFNE